MSLKLEELIKNSKKVVFFTGAGISTNSGIPDFRGPKGIWKTSTPIYFQDFISSKEKRIESWKRKFGNELSIDSAVPNEGHKKIAEIMTIKDSFLITQNVDNLHQDSGIDESKISELHGNATYAKCLDCGKRYELENLKTEFLKTNEPPICSICEGVIKTATISFGQAMPEEEMQISQRKAIESDLFICIGTSLAVFPAADLPLLAKETGAVLAILNNEPTQMDQYADLVINRDISQVFLEISI
ncbi:MAG: NAD-dependent deacetylase [Rickettsiales bacterium]|nr:NAD-dependent deacetylase [Rickettsiales bacterium]|tara:strand:+ start:6521 stop:7252 length:732 start_codon:yes stop_codon:yes gene_type:complete